MVEVPATSEEPLPVMEVVTAANVEETVVLMLSTADVEETVVSVLAATVE